MDEEKEVNLDYAFKYFIDFKEKPEHVYFEHAYNQPSYKEYHENNLSPAKYLFTTPTPNTIADTNHLNNEHIDVETVGHSPPLFYNSVKMNELIENDELPEFDDNWMDKVDYRDWNVVKNRLFRSAVQVLEADYLSRLANKGLRDEAVKRHLMLKKTASRLKRIYGSISWESLTCQWLHHFLIEKLPSCYVKLYTEAFQFMETKVPAHLLENMPITTSFLSIRSRILNPDQSSVAKKNTDVFSSALAQHKPKKILGEPMLVLVPTSMGNGFQPNTRPHRFMTELSLLGTLVTVTLPKSNTSIELPLLLEQMISATVAKIIEIQSDHPARPIILVGVDAGSLLACHIALGFSTKITAVVCIGFSIFTMEGKVGKANSKLLKLRTPLLFIIGQNGTTSTVDEIEEFRSKLLSKSGLIVVGGADDHLRVNHFIKMKCSITQNIVDRCILNEIAEFLNDVIQPPKVVVSIISSSDKSTSKTTATVSSAQAQLLKQYFSKNAILKNTFKTNSSSSQLKIDRELEKTKKLQVNRKAQSIEMESRKRSLQLEEIENLKKMTLSKLNENSSEKPGYHRIEFSGTPGTSFTYQVVGFNKKPSNIESVTVSAPPVYARRTRGGRRPNIRRTIPPKRTIGRPVVLSSYSSVHNIKNFAEMQPDRPSTIENLTPDNLLDLPIVFADENDEDNVINDVSLGSYEPK